MTALTSKTTPVNFPGLTNQSDKGCFEFTRNYMEFSYIWKGILRYIRKRPPLSTECGLFGVAAFVEWVCVRGGFCVQNVGDAFHFLLNLIEFTRIYHTFFSRFWKSVEGIPSVWITANKADRGFVF